MDKKREMSGQRDKEVERRKDEEIEPFLRLKKVKLD